MSTGETFLASLQKGQRLKSGKPTKVLCRRCCTLTTMNDVVKTRPSTSTFMCSAPVEKHAAFVPTSTSPISVPRESPVIYREVLAATAVLLDSSVHTAVVFPCHG